MTPLEPNPSADEAQAWWIELSGSELASVMPDGPDLVVTLSAARVSGDRSQLDLHLGGGHLRGVRCRLREASWSGELGHLIGRIDAAQWHTEEDAEPPPVLSTGHVRVPSQGLRPVRLWLQTAMGDTLVAKAAGWLIERPPTGAFSPSWAC